MRKILIVTLSLFLISCNSVGQERSKEENTSLINRAYKQNLASTTLNTGWYYVVKDSIGIARVDSISQVKYFINPKPIILPTNFKRSKEFKNYQGFKGLSIYFDKNGIELWTEATGNSIDEQLIFILNDKILTINLVNSQITNGVSAFWYDDLTDIEMTELKKLIKK